MAARSPPPARPASCATHGRGVWAPPSAPPPPRAEAEGQATRCSSHFPVPVSSLVHGSTKSGAHGQRDRRSGGGGGHHTGASSLGPSRGFLGQEREEGHSRQREQKAQREAQESQKSWGGLQTLWPEGGSEQVPQGKESPRVAAGGGTAGPVRLQRGHKLCWQKGETRGRDGERRRRASPCFSPVPKPRAGEGPPAGEMQPASPLPWRPGSSSQLLWGDGPPSPPQPGQG